MCEFPIVTSGDKMLKYVFPSKQAAAQTAISLAQNDKRIARLVIFGSAVTTDCGITSDIDLAIDAPSVDDDEFLKIIRPFYRDVESEIDIVHYNRIRNDILKKEIDEKGVCVYAKCE